MMMITPSRGRSKSPGGRPQTPLTKEESRVRLRELVEEAGLHTYALRNDMERLEGYIGLQNKDRQGKNFIRFLDAQDRHGNTALMCACWKGHLDIAQFLIKSGASLNIQNFYGWTATMWAVSNKHPLVVALLIAKGADLRVQTPVGRAAIDFADDEQIRLALKLVLDNPGTHTRTRTHTYIHTHTHTHTLKHTLSHTYILKTLLIHAHTHTHTHTHTHSGC